MMVGINASHNHSIVIILQMMNNVKHTQLLENIEAHCQGIHLKFNFLHCSGNFPEISIHHCCMQMRKGLIIFFYKILLAFDV